MVIIFFARNIFLSVSSFALIVVPTGLGSPIFGFYKSQLVNIQKRIIGSSLAVAGYNSKMPRAVVFGHTIYGGMNWESPYSILVFEQIKIVMGSIRMNNTIGKLLHIQMTWL